MNDATRIADLVAEGEPEKEFNPGIAGRLPRKTAAGGALIRNELGQILFLEPVYKPTLEIPGGVAEYDESPLDACSREIREELGFDIELGNLLIVDWVPAQGVWYDGLMFIFDGGILRREQIEQIKLDPTEAKSFKFLPLADAKVRLRPSLARRVATAEAAMRSGASFYAEFGRRLV
ncbi:NUDIX hydrolase [Kribbella sp. NPDC056861]|uniref:NUDIX hydrolase n=1 Tax=Kribbella sp. NPDC056861 TaxID=3154857 RepID=UPI00342F82F9